MERVAAAEAAHARLLALRRAEAAVEAGVLRAADAAAADGARQRRPHHAVVLGADDGGAAGEAFTAALLAASSTVHVTDATTKTTDTPAISPLPLTAALQRRHHDRSAGGDASQAVADALRGVARRSRDEDDALGAKDVAAALMGAAGAEDITPEQIRELLAELDYNNDGKVTYEDFLAAMNTN